MTDSKQSKGGAARAAALTPKKRQAIARNAAKARWRAPAEVKVTPAIIEAAKTNATLLTSIRRQFALAGCHKTAEAIQMAISSAKGLIRGLERRFDREQP